MPPSLSLPYGNPPSKAQPQGRAAGPGRADRLALFRSPPPPPNRNDHARWHQDRLAAQRHPRPRLEPTTRAALRTLTDDGSCAGKWAREVSCRRSAVILRLSSVPDSPLDQAGRGTWADARRAERLRAVCASTSAHRNGSSRVIEPTLEFYRMCQTLFWSSWLSPKGARRERKFKRNCKRSNDKGMQTRQAVEKTWRRVPESNRSSRICNPLRNLSANPPLSRGAERLDEVMRKRKGRWQLSRCILGSDQLQERRPGLGGSEGQDLSRVKA